MIFFKVSVICKIIAPKDLFNFKEEKPKEDVIVEIERCLRRNPTLLKTIYKIVLALDV